MKSIIRIYIIGLGFVTLLIKCNIFGDFTLDQSVNQAFFYRYPVSGRDVTLPSAIIAR